MKKNPPAVIGLGHLPVFEYRGKLVADSRDVAPFAGKRHDHLMRDISKYIAAIKGFSAPKVGEANALKKTASPTLGALDHTVNPKLDALDYFIEATYIDDQGKARPCFYCTEMGCEMVAHKMTGDKGIVFTALYVRAFHQMKDALRERQSPQWQQARAEGKATRNMETDAIKAFVAYAAASGSTNPDKYYQCFTVLANKTAGIEGGQRNSAPASVLINLRLVEQVIDRAIWAELAAGTEYHRAFKNVRDKVRQVAMLSFAPPPALPGRVG